MVDKLTNKTKGFSIIEIMIAMSIALIAITAVFLVSYGFENTILNGQSNSTGVQVAQGILENEQSIAKSNFSTLQNGVAAGPTCTLGTNCATSITTSTYTDATTCADPALCKLITTLVSWTGEHGESLKVSLSTVVTNAAGAGGACSQATTGNWKSPQLVSYKVGKDLINDPSSTSHITAVDFFRYTNIVGQKDYLFMTSNTTNPQGHKGKDTLFAFAFSPTSNPELPYSYSIDNAPSVNPGLNGVRVSAVGVKTYAFVANGNPASNFDTCSQSDTCAQLQIIDVSDPTGTVQWTVTTNYKIPTSDVAGKPGQSYGNAIEYKNGYVYLGLAATESGPEFNIIDVGGGAKGGTIASPQWAGGVSIGHDINAIYIQGTTAYVATADSRNLIAIDISNPTSPHIVGQYSPPNAPDSEGVGSDHGESVYAVNGNVYLGRTFGSKEFYMLDATNLSNVVGSKHIDPSNSSSVYGLIVRNTLAFLITDSQFQVWDISTPSSIVPYTPNAQTSQFLSLPGGRGTAIDCTGQTMFTGSVDTTNNNKGTLSIITPG